MRPKQATRPHAGNACCPNCGSRDIGSAAHCPDCGQENHEFDLTFGHVVDELLESTIRFDSKMFRTLGARLFRRGFLAKEYIGGRRQRSVPPIRLYIVVSLILYFHLAVFPVGDGHSQEKTKVTVSLSFYTVEARDFTGMNETQLHSVIPAKKIVPPAFSRYLARTPAIIERGGLDEYAHLMLKNVSSMMFVLMPMFGLFGFLLFRREAVCYTAGGSCMQCICAVSSSWCSPPSCSSVECCRASSRLGWGSRRVLRICFCHSADSFKSQLSEHSLH